MWERKGSLSFKNNLLTASCQCTLQFYKDQRQLGKGRQDFPHSWAYSISLNQQKYLLWRSLCQICQEQGSLKASHHQWSPSVCADPGQRFLSVTRQWAAALLTTGTTSWNIAMGWFCVSFLKLLSSKDFILCLIIFFSNPLLALKLVLWMFYLEPYTFKTLHIV